MNNKIILSVVAAIALIVGASWFSSSHVSPVQAVKDTQTVDLKDGDSYTLTASYVTKVIAGKEQKCSHTTA